MRGSVSKILYNSTHEHRQHMQTGSRSHHKHSCLNLTWIVFVIFSGGAAVACGCVPPMLLFRLSRSRASTILLLTLSCGAVLPLTLSPCTLEANCLVFTPARLLLACICICGTSFWLCSWCVTAVFCVVGTETFS